MSLHISLPVWSILILCNVIWSANPMMGKWVLAEYSPIQTAWIRYGGALLSYGIFSLISPRGAFARPKNTRDLWKLILLGLIPFCLTPLGTAYGLSLSTATENALLVATEPLITVFLAWVVLRNRMTWLDAGAMAIAMFGFFLLSGLGAHSFSELYQTSGALWGYVLLLGALFGEATFSVLGKDLTKRYSPHGTFGNAILAGVIGLTGVAGLSGDLFRMHLPSFKALMGALWLGPLGTMTAYLAWISVARKANISAMALSLFVQPVLGAVLGFFLLGEDLLSIQYLGGGLILCAVLGQTLLEKRMRSVT
jgi:drug/metabolite transporter (DMT)-like permease